MENKRERAHDIAEEGLDKIVEGDTEAGEKLIDKAKKIDPKAIEELAEEVERDKEPKDRARHQIGGGDEYGARQDYERRNVDEVHGRAERILNEAVHRRRCQHEDDPLRRACVGKRVSPSVCRDQAADRQDRDDFA